MSNKETLQEYNTKLIANNDSLQTVMNMIDNLPEAGGSTDILLQDKSIEITENGTTNIVADEGYDGLNSVDVTVNVAGSGETLEKGFIVKACNDTGYATEVDVVGITAIPNYAFGISTTSNASFLSKYLEKVTISNSVTTLGNNAFRYCQNLEGVELSDSITSIGSMAFYNCPNVIFDKLPDSITTINSQCFAACTNMLINNEMLPENLTTLAEMAFDSCTKLVLKTLPDGLTTVENRVFQSCKSIVQMSMKNVTAIKSTGLNYGAFVNCKGLTALWVGSAITSSGFTQYALVNCTNLSNIYIDLPRATVEAFTYYSTKWSNNTVNSNCQIICNDDEGFMTKEEFDAIDWATYTGE